MATSSFDKKFIIPDDKVADKFIEQLANPEQFKKSTSDLDVLASLEKSISILNVKGSGQHV